MALPPLTRRALRSGLLLVSPILAASCSEARARGPDGGQAEVTVVRDSVDEVRTADAAEAVAVLDTARPFCQGLDAGQATNPPYLDLNVTASGFGEHDGQTVFLVTRNNSSGVLGAGSAKVADGAFAFAFPRGYGRAADQEILWLLDGDGDGICDESAGDQTGYTRVGPFDPPGADALAVAITDNHVRTTSGNSNLCTPGVQFGDMLDMTIIATGFEAHEGLVIRLLSRTTYNGAVFAAGTTRVSGGGFTFHFPRGYQRFTYQEVMLFVDVDGDGVCTPGTDHTGFSATAAFNPFPTEPVDVPITDTHTARSGRGEDVCLVLNSCQVAP